MWEVRDKELPEGMPWLRDWIPEKDAREGKLGVRARWVGTWRSVTSLPIKQFILLFVYSFSKYLLSVYYVPGSVLGAGGTQ